MFLNKAIKNALLFRLFINNLLSLPPNLVIKMKKLLYISLLAPLVAMAQQPKDSITQLEEVVIKAEAPIKRIQKAAYNVVAIEAQPLQAVNSNAADILARVSGVKMRETGGVGAEANINLNGFTGRHVRTFIDGVPMNGANASFRINNIPAEMIERIEIYKGVVPITFGADALGGAVNIVTRRSKRNYANLSYTFGSFNTHKSTLRIGQRLTNNISFELNAYQNYSDNNYKVFTKYLDVHTGVFSKEPRWFTRFHDRYHNEALIGRLNIFNEKWADKLSFGLNYNQEYKQIQNANLMQIVFGGKYRTSHTYSSSMEYEKKNIIRGLSFALTGRYDLTTTRNTDEEPRQYAWDGTYRTKATKGEVQHILQTFEGKTGYVTSHIDYMPSPEHLFQVSNTYSHYKRTTTDNVVSLATTAADFMRRVNQKNIVGFSYKFAPNNLWNVLAFAKYYTTKVTGPVQIAGNASNAVYEEQSRYSSTTGYGLATTYQLLNPLQVKLSYEKTFRLPTERELFGDGDLEQGDQQLKPENSHNINFNLSYQPVADNHSFLIEAGVAYRNITDYIIRGINSRGIAASRNHGNVLNIGADLSARYFYKNSFALGGNITYMDIRNKEKKTAFGANSLTYNDRVPNVPYFFANADTSYNFKGIFAKKDQLSLTYNLLYTDEFYLTWQSEGAKNTVPSQLSHDVNITYQTSNKKISISAEIKNLTDQLLYDNYSLQKAGRAFYAKLSYRFY